MVLSNKYSRRLGASLANRHDSPKLELLRAWELSDNSRPLPIGEGKEAQLFVSYGNSKQETKDGRIKSKIRI